MRGQETRQPVTMAPISGIDMSTYIFTSWRCFAMHSAAGYIQSFCLGLGLRLRLCLCLGGAELDSGGVRRWNSECRTWLGPTSFS